MTVSTAIELSSQRLRLWMPSPTEAETVVAFFQRNARHLQRWSPPCPDGFYTIAYWRRRLARNIQELDEDHSVRLFASLHAAPERIIGSLSAGEIVRGAFQACYLGYNLDEAEQGKGLMSEAVRTLIDHLFGIMGLHRVMANYIPTNERSAALLKRLGFSVEGYARDYLFINGAWRDHILTALTNPSATPPR